MKIETITCDCCEKPVSATGKKTTAHFSVELRIMNYGISYGKENINLEHVCLECTDGARVALYQFVNSKREKAKQK